MNHVRERQQSCIPKKWPTSYEPLVGDFDCFVVSSVLMISTFSSIFTFGALVYHLWCFYCHFAVLFSSNSFTCSSSHLLRDLCRTSVWRRWWQSVETYGTVCPQSTPFHPLPCVIVERLVSRASCLFQQDPVPKIPHVPFRWDMTCWFVCVYDRGGNGSDHTQIVMRLWSSLEFKYRD